MKKNNSLKDRLKKSYESKDKGGNNRPSAFDWKKIGETKFFKPKEGKNRINIIPYPVKTKNDPLVRSGDAKIGDLSYMLDIWLHKNIGPTQAEIICQKSNFNKPCPICKAAQEFKDAGKKEEAAALWPKRQCFYNIIDVKNPDAGIQIFSISHFLFEKELIEEARASSDDGDIVDFVDIDEGKTVTFRAAETTSNINGKAVTFLEYKSFGFVEREDPLDEALVNDAISFDELMKLPTNDEIEKILFGDDEEDEDGEDEEESDDDNEDEDDDEKPAPKSKKGNSKSTGKTSSKSRVAPSEEGNDDDEEDEPEDDDDDASDSEEAEDDDNNDEGEDDNDDDEEKPAVKKTRGRPNKTVTKEKPTPAKGNVKTTRTASKGKVAEKPECPSGHTWCKDCDVFEDCDDCTKYKACREEADKRKGKGR